MSSSKGFTKLIDIHDQAARLHGALEKYLDAHGIPYQIRKFKGDGFFRYKVKQSDLCCAQAVIPALRDMASLDPGSSNEGGRD